MDVVAVVRPVVKSRDSSVILIIGISEFSGFILWFIVVGWINGSFVRFWRCWFSGVDFEILGWFKVFRELDCNILAVSSSSLRKVVDIEKLRYSLGIIVNNYCWNR